MPAIIFVDEVDAVGRHRGAGLGGGHDEREQTLNQLLVEMDGFEPKISVIVIAATNRPDILDPALLRPGRFDRHIVIDKPDIKGREEILKIHSRDKKLDSNVDLSITARRTPGFTGADLANLVNEAALLAARRDKKTVTMEEMEESIERVLAGPQKKSRIISEKEKGVVAYHEVGHALVAKSLPNADPVHKISILPRGLALGYTLQLPIEDRHLIAKAEAMDRITVMLGGRVAEEIAFHEITTGAQNDLEQATDLARKMVCEYGMSDLGPRTFGKKLEHVFLGRDFGEQTKNYGDTMADAIDAEVKKIFDQCYQKAKEIIGKNKDGLVQLSNILMEREIIEGEELNEIWKKLNGNT
jgi:cell division protease FtsH